MCAKLVSVSLVFLPGGTECEVFEFSVNSQGERSTLVFFFSSRRRHTRSLCDWSSDVCSSDLTDRSVRATECVRSAVAKLIHEPVTHRPRLVRVQAGCAHYRVAQLVDLFQRAEVERHALIWLGGQHKDRKSVV